MKKIILFITLMLIATATFADYTFIVPQKPGGGTDLWARTIAQELEKKLGEKIKINNLPGINDVPGFNKFHNELQYDDKNVMVAHGGNAESFLVQNVDYDYFDYEPIALQNLTIMVGKRNDHNHLENVKFAAGSGMNPDAMAITMLICGPKNSLLEYKQCFDQKFIYVKGMSGGERRLAYMRGELNVTRENPLAYKKHAEKIKENVNWFSHGVMNIDTLEIINDANFPNLSFVEVYKNLWKEEPKGDFYHAYILSKSYRDVLQKSLWVRKDNSNVNKLITAFNDMINDDEAMNRIYEKTGKYDFIVGKKIEPLLVSLQTLKDENNLMNLKWIIKNMLHVN